MTETPKKKTTYSLDIVLLALLIGILAGVLFTPKATNEESQLFMAQNKMSQRVNAVLTLIDNRYVDIVDYDSLSDQMLNAMLSTLDPHSYYLSPSSFEKESETMAGQFDGIGVTLFYVGDTVYASQVMPGSPAEKVGIHPGDRILRVDTTLVSGTGMTKESSTIVNLIRGPRYSNVKLTVQRQGSSKLHTFKVRRDKILMSTVPAYVMVNSNTGYIRISRFGDHTGKEFHAALLQLLNKNMQNLIVDLRDNAGGSLASCLEVCDELLPEGNLIVYTQGAHIGRSDVYATSGGLFEKGKLTVLVDERSASASEIVAGAVQDNDRGTIMGHLTFGKGLVQSQYPLSDGSAVLLTIARYYTPSGRCIQRPYDKGTDEYYSQYISRIIENYMSADSILDAGYDTTQVFLTKNGRKVYGGGGIRPDILLPYFTDTNLVYYNRIISKRVLEDYLHQQLFLHYDQLISRYPTFDVFMKEYQVSDATWKAILALADKRGIARHAEGLRKYGDDIRTRYKALMASTLYGENAYYTLSLPGDTELQRAVENIKKKTNH